MNTITRKDLNQYYLNNDKAKWNANTYFGDNQPSVYQTGFYSAPSWNWGYIVGITGVTLKDGSTMWFEVVTQFGQVKAARGINLPTMNIGA